MKYSIVIPVFNEEKNIPLLLPMLTSALVELPPSEIIIVDDGSRDGTFEALKKEGKNIPTLRVIRLYKNSGQTAALQAGIDSATTDIIVTLDGDTENNPYDIPALLAKLGEGYDVVSGWRQNRWSDQKLLRRLPSRLANSLISKITGLPLHDYGCTLKAYRTEILRPVRLYGEMHRFIPAFASWYGARVTEIPVSYQPRKFGKSNYGFSRVFRVLLDLLLIRFLERYMHRPIHFFGKIGTYALLIGGVSGCTAIGLKIIHSRDFVETPLPIFSAMFIIIGLQFILMGILAEIVMRTYYESQNRTTYMIRETFHTGRVHHHALDKGLHSKER